MIRTKAYARAGLVGNPSDGYNGRTISLIVRNFAAEAIIYEWPEIEIIPTRQDQCRFNTLTQMLHDLEINGYYGGMRLVKAAIKRFADYCREQKIELPARNFSLRYGSTIPRQVGLAGSSAIITAVMRALMAFYEIDIKKEILPNLILETETREIGITAGLQDRVAQVYEGLVYMDFNREFMEEHKHGLYESMDAALLPPIYIAYQQELAEVSDVFHNNIRERYDSGERAVIDAISRIAEIAREAREALLKGDHAELARLMNENFDRRRSIYDLNLKHICMVELARKIGASAKFAGSGGSVIGTYEDEAMYTRLKEAFHKEGCAILKPIVVER
ncbi:MAG: GHMP kinase [Acidobacteria bacterium]|nr:GHMP kinase [Acidobacteriota bacterium]